MKVFINFVFMLSLCLPFSNDETNLPKMVIFWDVKAYLFWD
jgi:hypothetical protein